MFQTRSGDFWCFKCDPVFPGVSNIFLGGEDQRAIFPEAEVEENREVVYIDLRIGRKEHETSFRCAALAVPGGRTESGGSHSRARKERRGSYGTAGRFLPARQHHSLAFHARTQCCVSAFVDRVTALTDKDTHLERHVPPPPFLNEAHRLAKWVCTSRRVSGRDATSLRTLQLDPHAFNHGGGGDALDTLSSCRDPKLVL